MKFEDTKKNVQELYKKGTNENYACVMNTREMILFITQSMSSQHIIAYYLFEPSVPVSFCFI